MGKSGKEDLFRKFKDSFDNMEGHFHVLDHRVPVEVQLAYFRYSEKLRKEKPLDYPVSDETCEELYQTLLTTDGGNSVKRRLLALLAISRSVRAYRLLEEYAKEPDPAIANWAYMAAMEARLTLESELSDEKQIFISTGLGGRDDKLRYYVLLVCREPQGFLDYQRQVIEREFAYYLERQDWRYPFVDKSDAAMERMLREGPYGRCVYACDNDAVDHQIVNLRFEGGVSVAHQMESFTYAGGRHTKIFGTRGEIVGDGRHLTIHHFDTRTTELWDAALEAGLAQGSGHGGGDYGLMDELTRLLREGDPATFPGVFEASLESHRIAFAAEASRKADGALMLAE